MKTLADITKLYKETFYTTDDESIAIVAAVVISSKLSTPPIWLYLIGPSSGGKSALIDAFGLVPFVTQVSDLTPNTFLSGMPIRNGKETSLLRRLGPNFVITMKDFTTILSKADQDQQAIIAQMREIYDGYITKETGTGQTLSWGGKGGKDDPKGKATFIMASTEAVFKVQEKFSDMGTRAINYILKPINRVEATRAAIRNNNTLEERVTHIQEEFREYVMGMLENIPQELPAVDQQMEDDIIRIADLASVARSAVHRDYKGAKFLVPSAEMPMRMSKQLLSMAQVLTFMSGGTLPENLRRAVYKIGFDSIPKQRRQTLEALARYNRVSKAGVADYLNFPPERAQEWIEDLNSFGFCLRRRVGSKNLWELRPDYRETMLKFCDISRTDGDLDAADEPTSYETAGIDDSYEFQEAQVIMQEEAQKDFEAI